MSSQSEVRKYSAHRAIYHLNGNELDHVFEEKDLRVHVDSELKFEDHMSKKINKANALVGLIRRSISHLDAKMFKKLFLHLTCPQHKQAEEVQQIDQNPMNLDHSERMTPLKVWPMLVLVIGMLGVQLQINHESDYFM